MAIVLLIKVKYYVAAVFLPLVAIAAFMHVRTRWALLQTGYVRYLLPFVILALVIAFVFNLSPNFQPDYFLYRVVTDHNRLLEDTDPQFRIAYSDYQPTFTSFLINSPKAVFSGFYRPMVGEGAQWTQLLAGIQNLFLFIMSLWSITYVWVNKVKLSATAWCMLLYCVVLATFLAFATPNFGTLERYKSMYQPFFLLLFVPGAYKLASLLKSKKK